jgi:hypothetical protein
MSGYKTLRRALATTALAGALASFPAIAQVVSPAPVRQSVDANGIDLFFSTFNVKTPPLSIG